MTVTALRQTSPDGVTVCLSDGAEIRATLNVVADLRLYVGCELEEEALRKLREASSLALTKKRALELLGRRAMSAKELFDKLVCKGEAEANAAAAVRWLLDNRLLDDEGYAAAVVRHYAAKGYGAGRIRQELFRRGIERELWDAALEEQPDGREQLDKFIAARLRDPKDREQVRNVSAALFRRGFSWEEIRSALRRYSVEPEDE